MKKIVIIHPAYWEQSKGGAEIQIHYLIKFLLKNNFEIHYIFEDQKIIVTNLNNINLHPLKKIEIRKTLGKRWFLYRKKIENKLSEIRPDIIYTRFSSSWSGIAANYAKKKNILHVWALSSDNDLKISDNWLSFFKPLDFFEKRKILYAFKHASIILTQNKYQQKLLLDKFNRDGNLIPQSTEFCDENLIVKKTNEITILWIANFKPLKRPELFISIAKHFKDVENIKFRMIGRINNTYAQLIDLAIEEIPNFKYLGELENYIVNENLCSSHILINTSEYEGFSNTFVQAWMRKVVVISMMSNPDSIITENNIGFICPTVDEIVQQIYYLSSNHDIMDIMGNKAYKYALENHLLEKNLEKIVRLFN